MTQTNFFLFSIDFCLNRILRLWSNSTEFMCSKFVHIYSLFVSLFVSLCFIFRNSLSLEFVLRHRLVSPLLMALTVVVGGIYNCLLLALCECVHLGVDLCQIFHLCVRLHLGIPLLVCCCCCTTVLSYWPEYPPLHYPVTCGKVFMSSSKTMNLVKWRHWTRTSCIPSSQYISFLFLFFSYNHIFQ